MKKKIILAMTIAAVLFASVGCSSENGGSDATTTTDTVAVDTTTTAAETKETTTAETTAAETNATEAETEETTAAEPESEYITVFAEGKTSDTCLSYEGEKGVWAHLVNPFNSESLFEPFADSEFSGDEENLIICFNVSGVSEPISAFCGISAVGISPDDEEISIWDKDAYNKLTGEDFDFVIENDGYCEMIVPIKKMSDGLDFWEGLKNVTILEPVFYNVQAVDDEGNYKDALIDGLSFEFLGIKAE